jgi:energy-coupling factor transport system ATP-binding protein
MREEVLRIENLTHVYSAGTPFERVAVDNVSLSVHHGEFIGLIGHTGSGKSTLIQHFNGLLKPSSGRVLINGEDIFQSKEMTRGARFAVGLVFQYPEYQLFEETVYKDIAFGPKNMGLDETEIDRRVRDAANIVGLAPETLEKSPFELSGGQKRRVALAGVFAMEPQVLVLDEPMAGLDPAGREDVFAFIKEYQRQHGITVIFVTHSMEDAAKMADRIIVMEGGRILLEGTPEEIFRHADRLTEAGLNIPQVTQVFCELRKRGVDIPVNVYTVEQALDVLRRRKEQGHA